MARKLFLCFALSIISSQLWAAKYYVVDTENKYIICPVEGEDEKRIYDKSVYHVEFDNKIGMYEVFRKDRSLARKRAAKCLAKSQKKRRSSNDILDRVAGDQRYKEAVAYSRYEKARQSYQKLRLSESKNLGQIKAFEDELKDLMDQNDSFEAKYGAKNLLAMMYYHDLMTLIRTAKESNFFTAERLFGQVVFDCRDRELLAEARYYLGLIHYRGKSGYQSESIETNYIEAELLFRAVVSTMPKDNVYSLAAKYYLAEMSEMGRILGHEDNKYRLAASLYREVITFSKESKIKNLARFGLALLHASRKTRAAEEDITKALEEADSLLNEVINHYYSDEMVQ